jgi:Ca-activated chloride channel family protein
MQVSTGETLARIRSSRSAILRKLPALLRLIGLALLVFALSRPLMGFQPRKDRAEVVDIMLAVDVSGSMRAIDREFGDRNRDRLDVVKEAVADFIESRKYKETDRFGLDRVGMVLYASYAWTQSPLTLDYGLLQRDIENTYINERDQRSQRTAIGSAIGLAVGRLRKSEAESKVIVLLTDGLNNAGELDPITAAEIAKEFGIRVYTIGAGSTGEVFMQHRGILGPTTQRLRGLELDVNMLTRIADITGGKFYRATDIESLHGAYEEINQLETTEIEMDDYYEYEEGFMPFTIAGTLMLALAVFSRRTWFDPIP